MHNSSIKAQYSFGYVMKLHYFLKLCIVSVFKNKLWEIVDYFRSLHWKFNGKVLKLTSN